MSNNIPSSDNPKYDHDSAIKRRDFLISIVASAIVGCSAVNGWRKMCKKAQEKHDELQEIFSRDFEYINDQFAENFLVSDKILSKNTMSKNTMEKIGYSTIVPVRDKDGNECSFIGIRNGVLTIESVDKEKSKIKLSVPLEVAGIVNLQNVELSYDNLFVYSPKKLDPLTVTLRDDDGIPDLRNITFIDDVIKLDFSGIKSSPAGFVEESKIFHNIASHQPNYKDGKQDKTCKLKKPQTIFIKFSSKQLEKLTEEDIRTIISPLFSKKSGYLLNIEIEGDKPEERKSIREGDGFTNKNEVIAARGNLERYLNRGHETTISRT